MVDLLVTIVNGFAKAVMEIGLWRCFLAAVGLFVTGLIWKNLIRLDRVLDRVERRWRKTPNSAKPTIYMIVFLLFGGTVWAAAPKRGMFMAISAGVVTVWFVGGARHRQHYGLDGGIWAAWKHHYEVTRGRHKLTQAMEASSPKSGGKARKVRLTPDGAEFIGDPHDGQSADEYIEEVNAGRHAPATARRLDFPVKTMTATKQADGTVLVKVSREQTAQEADPLVDANWWDGKP